jgi:hypothetical protein
MLACSTGQHDVAPSWPVPTAALLQGRYPVHMHRTRQNSSTVQGCAVYPSSLAQASSLLPRHGIVQHDTQAQLLGNVVVGARGSGLFLEEAANSGGCHGPRCMLMLCVPFVVLVLVAGCSVRRGLPADMKQIGWVDTNSWCARASAGSSCACCSVYRADSVSTCTSQEHSFTAVDYAHMSLGASHTDPLLQVCNG